MKKIVTTSWDDGHKLDLKLAQLLQKYNVPATFYISRACRGFSNNDLLTEQEIRTLSKDFEIGGHTFHHSNLAQVPLDVAVDDIKGGKDFLESIIRKKLQSFAYPYGAYNQQVQKAVLDLGFKIARTTKRFSIEPYIEYSALTTTVQVYTHLSDIVQLPKYRTIQWQKLARYYFDQFLEKGGVFHLWGHSWEVDKYNQWKNLETFFEYISNRDDVTYISNGRLA